MTAGVTGAAIAASAGDESFSALGAAPLVRLDTAFRSRLASVGFTTAAGKLPGCRLQKAGENECVT